VEKGGGLSRIGRSVVPNPNNAIVQPFRANPPPLPLYPDISENKPQAPTPRNRTFCSYIKLCIYTTKNSLFIFFIFHTSVRKSKSDLRFLATARDGLIHNPISISDFRLFPAKFRPRKVHERSLNGWFTKRISSFHPPRCGSSSSMQWRRSSGL